MTRETRINQEKKLRKVRINATLALLFLIFYWGPTLATVKTEQEQKKVADVIEISEMKIPIENELILPKETVLPTPTQKVDVRIGKIYNYYAGNNAPLKNYAWVMVQQGDKYGVDPLLIAAIGQIESSGGRNLCAYGLSKNEKSSDTNNPFGILVRQKSGEYKCRFYGSIDESIYALVGYLSNDDYKGKNKTQILLTYNPKGGMEYVNKVMYVYNKINSK